MKKLSVLLILTMLISMLAACGSASSSDASSSSASLKPAASSQSAAEETQMDVLYAVFSAEDVREYPIEYTGAQKTAEELADELSELTGLDFIITISKNSDGWIVDWSADSTLVAGLHDREQKEEFFFFDQDTLSWFMMDSLWRTLTENLDTENIYYTMDGGKELVFTELYPVSEFPSDVPYMGSEFYYAHTDVQGYEENPYACTKGLWRMDETMGTASIVMDGFGRFTMYYASGSVEADGYLECVDEYKTATTGMIVILLTVSGSPASTSIRISSSISGMTMEQSTSWICWWRLIRASGSTPMEKYLRSMAEDGMSMRQMNLTRSHGGRCHMMRRLPI